MTLRRQTRRVRIWTCAQFRQIGTQARIQHAVVPSYVLDCSPYVWHVACVVSNKRSTGLLGSLGICSNNGLAAVTLIVLQIDILKLQSVRPDQKHRQVR